MEPPKASPPLIADPSLWDRKPENCDISALLAMRIVSFGNSYRLALRRNTQVLALSCKCYANESVADNSSRPIRYPLPNWLPQGFSKIRGVRPHHPGILEPVA